MNEKRISIRLPTTDLEEISKDALLEDRTVSWVIRQAVRERLDRKGKKEKQARVLTT